MPLREIARRTGLSCLKAIEAPSVRDQWLRDQEISAGGHRQAAVLIAGPAGQAGSVCGKAFRLAGDATAQVSQRATINARRATSGERRATRGARPNRFMRIWSSLALIGPASGLRPCVRDWKGDRLRARQTADRGTDLPLVFRPGEAFQFDWPVRLAGSIGQRDRPVRSAGSIGQRDRPTRLDAADRACVGGQRIKCAAWPA